MSEDLSIYAKKLKDLSLINADSYITEMKVTTEKGGNINITFIPNPDLTEKQVNEFKMRGARLKYFLNSVAEGKDVSLPQAKEAKTDLKFFYDSYQDAVNKNAEKIKKNGNESGAKIEKSKVDDAKKASKKAEEWMDKVIESVSPAQIGQSNAMNISGGVQVVSNDAPIAPLIGGGSPKLG